MSSDSDDSDFENGKKMDKNNNSQSEDNENKTLSPLAKRNSTLTSLLTSSPKNENVNRVHSPTKAITSNGRSQRLDTFNKENEDEAKSSLLELKPEKRPAITFNFFSRDKKKAEMKNENGDGAGGDVKSKDKKTVVGIATPYYSSNECIKVNGDKERKDDENIQHSETNGNGLTNGLSKTNNVVNGSSKIGPNGWIIEEIEEKYNVVMNGTTEKIYAKSEWIVAEKNAKTCSS